MVRFLFILSCILFIPLAIIFEYDFNRVMAKSPYIWPTQSTTLSSAFGPRLLASEDYRYDFHRGVDIPGDLGSPISAISDGDVYRVYEEGNIFYPNGGNVVIIRHQDTSGKTFYSIYEHLDSIAVIQDTPVTADATIGTMGQSGSATYTHLHFEIRETTSCSLESQLTGSCTYYGFDPHVNPLFYIAEPNSTAPQIDITNSAPLTVRITVASTELDFNRLEVLSETGESFIFDFNTREGFDATSTEALDTATRNNVTISPAAFNSNSTTYTIDFTFQNLSSYSSIIAKDIWSNAAELVTVEQTDDTSSDITPSDTDNIGTSSGSSAETPGSTSSNDSIPSSASISYSDEASNIDEMLDPVESQEITENNDEKKSVYFKDISGHWAEKMISTVAENGIVQGYSDGFFLPDASLNRAEAAVLFFRVLGEASVTPKENPFSDVFKAAWYADEIALIKELGIVKGNPNGTYEPSHAMNRAEFLELAMNVYFYQADEELRETIQATRASDTTTHYADLEKTAWYASSVTAATTLGFIEGRVCAKTFCFEADASITRAEAVKIIYHMFFKN